MPQKTKGKGDHKLASFKITAGSDAHSGNCGGYDLQAAEENTPDWLAKEQKESVKAKAGSSNDRSGVAKIVDSWRRNTTKTTLKMAHKKKEKAKNKATIPKRHLIKEMLL